MGKKEPTGKLEEARLRSKDNQKERVLIRVGSNTTIIGLGDDAKIVGGGLYVKNAENVIIRNIEFENAYDFFPGWDPTDGSSGNWNSEYDNLLIEMSKNIWIDHCSFNDGDQPDELTETHFGREFQHHDGLLDIKSSRISLRCHTAYFQDILKHDYRIKRQLQSRQRAFKGDIPPQSLRKYKRAGTARPLRKSAHLQQLF